MIFERLSDPTTKHIMGNLDDYPLADPEAEDDVVEETSVMADYRRNELSRIGKLFALRHLVSGRLVLVLLLHWGSVQIYYYRNCISRPDGSLVSKEMYLPKDLSCNLLSLMFGADIAEVDKPFWHMPGS